jgi:uncharacterized protein
MDMTKAQLILLLLVSSVFAVCIPTQRSMYVPAVINENYSEMLSIDVETQVGNGEMYASVGPQIGSYTQESEKMAASVAYAIAGEGSKDCDVLLRIETPESVSKIDGPSAGAAMTLLILSALENKQLRQDFAITGTIEEDQSVGPVGGVPLKAEAVAKLGKNIFIVPYLDSTEKILMLIMQKNYDITTIQVNSITEAYDIAQNTSMQVSNIVLSNETIPSFKSSTLNHSYAAYFMNVSKKMIRDAEALANSVGDRQPNAKGNLLSRVEIAKVADRSGNYYTAANTVFILGVDSNLLDYSEDEFYSHLESTQRCIDEFVPNDVGTSSLDNFELSGAANLRYLWAKKRLPSETSLDELETLSMKLSTYSDVLYSESWCTAAEDMSTFSHEKGRINMTKAGEIAKKLIDTASDDPNIADDEDLNWHLAVAQEAYDKEMYIEAIIDANFVIAGERILSLGNMTLKEASAEINNIIDEKGAKNYTFLWPQLYKNHAKTFESSDEITAARLYILADGIEGGLSEVRNASVSSSNGTLLNVTMPEAPNNTAPPIGETRRFAEPEPMEGWDLRYLLYILIMIALGYIIQHERSKRMKEKESRERMLERRQLEIPKP